jgi:hypothetical protein
MDVDQLRAAFLFSSTISERIERFRERLVDYILQAKSTVPIATGAPMLLMQVVPYESLEPSRLIDIVAADSDAYATLAPVGQGGTQRRFNADGILGYVTDKDREGKTFISAYTQLYRTGVIESADTTMLGRGREWNVLDSEYETGDRAHCRRQTIYRSPEEAWYFSSSGRPGIFAQR